MASFSLLILYSGQTNSTGLRIIEPPILAFGGLHIVPAVISAASRLFGFSYFLSSPPRSPCPDRAAADSHRHMESNAIILAGVISKDCRDHRNVFGWPCHLRGLPLSSQISGGMCKIIDSKPTTSQTQSHLILSLLSFNSIQNSIFWRRCARVHPQPLLLSFSNLPQFSQSLRPFLANLL